LQRQSQQIALLKESEASLRQTCSGLRQELRRVETAFAESQKNTGQRFKFKPKVKANKKAGQGIEIGQIEAIEAGAIVGYEVSLQCLFKSLGIQFSYNVF